MTKVTKTKPSFQSSSVLWQQ